MRHNSKLSESNQHSAQTHIHTYKEIHAERKRHVKNFTPRAIKEANIYMKCKRK